jgi:DNA-binding GntR family transcriptional regulator
VTIDPEGERPIYQQLADVLRDMIMSGELPAGRPLPSEQVLRQTYGVSRGTARHAAALLVAEGLARTSPGRGHFVTRSDERPR